MIDFTLAEAQLFRLLAGFFGRDQVIPRMSAMAVCGGELPAGFEVEGTDMAVWARSNQCLFTIVDRDEQPKMVVEFFFGFDKSIEFSEAEHQRFLKPLLEAARIMYITISENEFAEMTSPSGNLDFYHWLKFKVGYDESDPA